MKVVVLNQDSVPSILAVGTNHIIPNRLQLTWYLLERKAAGLVCVSGCLIRQNQRLNLRCTGSVHFLIS
jgi:hypothetical protein